MCTIKRCQVLVVVLIVSIFFSRYGIHAQESSERHPVTVDVSAIASDRHFTELEKRVMGILKYELKIQGGVLSEKPEWELFIGAKAWGKSEPNQIVLSVFTLKALPGEILQACGEQEVFYAYAQKKGKALPEEGKHIRQFVTRDYLSQFRSVRGHDIIIIKESDLEVECKKIVDEFLQDHTGKLTTF